MQANDSSFVHSLSAAGSSMVQVGNNYNTTHHYHSGISDQDRAKIPAALCTTDPRHDKARIETTNGILLRDSYKWILNNPEFLSWRDNTLDSRLLWIRGDPGKGKTMLMCGIIDELEASTSLGNPERPILLSYFFCQATNSGLNNYTAVLRGLIYMLVTHQPSLLSHLDGKQEYITAHWNSRVVMEEIFRNILADTGLQETYFIVDALDECLDELSFFLDMLSSTCSRARWIVSSRNHCEIQEHFNQQPSKIAISLELNAESVSQAVEHFISYRTRRLVEKKNLQNDVAEEVHHHLSKTSEGTFLWVSLACQRLEKCRVWEISNELLQFPLGLNNLYERMLAQIRSSSSSVLYIRLLATISTVFRPLTFPELIAMEKLNELNIDERVFPDVIAECGSFLTARENTVFFIHQSAKDFLINESGPVLFKSGLAQHHCALFQRSIAMLQVLHKDLYGLVRIGIAVEEAIRERPEPDPLRSLKYACTFWADHLQTACGAEPYGEFPQKNPVIKVALDFITNKFLFWLEALSLCQESSAALNALLCLKALITDFSQLGCRDMVEDALRFFRFFRHIIDRCPLQIYASGLLFSPQNSFVRHRFKYCTPDILIKSPEVDKNWNAVQTHYDHPCYDRYSTTKFLPDAQQLLTISPHDKIIVWHVEDGTIHKKVQAQDIDWATVSSDLKWLAVVTLRSTSNFKLPVQHTLQVRGFTSNKVVWNKELNGHLVKGIEISPDNRLLAVCYKAEVELYDLDLIKLEVSTVEPSFALDHEEIEGTEGRISFSSDGALVALDANFTFDIQNGHWYEKYLPRGTWVGVAKFIPGTYTLASCNTERIVNLWHASKGSCEEWRLPHEVYSLGFPHHNNWIIICGYQCLYLYDLEQRKLLQSVDLPAGSDAWDIIVSQDDKTIVVSAYHDVLVLDVHALLTQKSPLTPSGILRYDMSDDWRLSARHLTNKIEIWDNMIGTKRSELPLGHTSIRQLKFSASGQYLSFTYNKPHCLLVSVYTLSNNSLRNYSGHQFQITGVAISDNSGSEGHWLATRSDAIVSVWDITTGKHRTFIDLSNVESMKISQMVFAGSRLGVLFQHSLNPYSSRHEFSLLNVRTGEQLYTLLISPAFHPSDINPILRLSSNGQLGMVYNESKRCLSIWDSEGNICCTTFDESGAEYFSFQDGKTIYTEWGHFPIDSIPIQSIELQENSSYVSLTDTREELDPEVVEPEFEGYGYIGGDDWITLDNILLLWLPVQYRPDVLGGIACGDDYVVVKSSSGVYSIRFKENARDFI